jgi:hypothetical protein
VLVAIETEIASGDVLLGNAAFPGARDAHHENDVGVAVRQQSLETTRTSPTECAGEDCSIAGLKAEPRSGGCGAGGLRTAGARNRDDGG